MKVEKQFLPLVLEEHIESPDASYSRHSHNYYTMVYVQSGSGMHYLNEKKYRYASGSFFSISTEDTHYFEIWEKSHFSFIRFTENYFENYRMLLPPYFQAVSPFDIIRQQVFRDNLLNLGQPFQNLVSSTVQSIMAYSSSGADAAKSAVVFHLILTVLAAVRENLNLSEAGPADRGEMLDYIHKNIYSREKLEIRSISSEFNIAQGYFSAYFKNRFEIKYKDYVAAYRDQLIIGVLSSGQFNSKSIAADFGFTDESHFIRYFKSRHGVTPGQYKMKTQRIKNGL